MQWSILNISLSSLKVSMQLRIIKPKTMTQPEHQPFKKVLPLPKYESALKCK